MISQIHNFITSLKYQKKEYGILQYSKSPILSENDLVNLIKESQFTIENGNFHLGGTGLGVNIAVIDTGVDPFHHELKNVIPLNFTKEDFKSEMPPYYDNQGHGTFVISLLNGQNRIPGIVKNSLIYSMKVINYSSPSLHQLENNIVKAINQAIQYNCKIITISIGMPHKSILLEKAINNAVSKGTLVFSASGNEGIYGSKYKSYPASFENVISVASADKRGLPSWFSTQGLGRNPLTQPEAAIASLNYHLGAIPKGQYAKMFGTSFACPILAGIGAKWIEANIFRPKSDSRSLVEFRKWMKENSVDSNNNGWDNSLGYGVIKLNKNSF